MFIITTKSDERITFCIFKNTDFFQPLQEELSVMSSYIYEFPKGKQPWLFIGGTDAEAWPPDAKSWLIRKDPDAGKHWRQEEKGMTEDEIVGWHHWLNGHEFEQALEDGAGQGNLACCNPWGRKESDMTEYLNNIWIGQCDQLCPEFGYLIIILKKTFERFPIYLILSLLICYIWDKITFFACGEL